MPWRLVAAVAGGCLLGGTAAAAAQTSGHAALTSPEGRCKFCHVSHAAGTRYVLMTDAAGEPQTWLAAQAPGATTSASCLRCHWTQDTRARQPDGPQLPSSGGLFVGPVLADDHPLGRGPTASPTSPAIDCPQCHDPHDPTRLITPPSLERALCRQCHGPEASTQGAHAPVVCSACHQVHNSAQSGLLFGVTIEGTCTRCHTIGGGANPTRDSLVAAGKTPYVSEPAHNLGSNCLQCHSIHP